jgi:gamma-glutamyl hercynylcysteine S-oxide synthase
MPKQSRPDTRADAADASVHLKPFLGMKPGAYLSILYGLALLVVVFLFLFLPGLRHRGSYLTVETFPYRATVKVDGVYAGTTPCTVFLKRGGRALDISKPYYAGVSERRTVRGRVFATWIVPDRSRFSIDLKPADATGLLQWALSDFQRNPEIPQLISDAALAADGSADPAAFHRFIRDALLSVTDEAQLREALLAAARVSSDGGVLTASSYLDMIRGAAAVLESQGNSSALLTMTLSRAHGARLSSSAWSEKHLADYRAAISRYYQSGAASGGSTGGVTVRGMAFRSIPTGDLVMGKDDNLDAIGKSVDRLLPHPVRVSPFYLGANEVPSSLYLAFVNENPDWSPANTLALIQKGLVTDDYLMSWRNGKPAPGAENLPVTEVSWHAAQAFCAWLTRSVQGSLPGYTARLPLESEWEWAARGGLRGMPYPLGGKPGGAVFHKDGIAGPSPVGTSEPNGYGLRDMLGNVWEWCADPALPNAGIFTSLDPQANALLERSLPDSPDRSVRGGGWANQSGSDKVYTRGSQPIDWCTPYLGFRVALSRY